MTAIDVVIPNYNYGRYLAACVTSVTTQDIGELRVLVIDNASDDKSVEVVQELARRDPRVEILARPKNLGQHASYNDGIDWARSDYFLILSADDFLVEGSLGRAQEVMDDHPDVHLTFGRTFLVDAARHERIPRAAIAAKPHRWHLTGGQDLIRHFCRTGRNHVGASTAIVRTEVQKKVGHYRTELPHTDDLEVWMRLACHGSVAATSGYQAVARVHPDSQSSSVANANYWNLQFEAAFEAFFRNEGASLSDAALLRRMAITGLGERAFCSGIAALLRREPGARDLLAYSIRTRRAWGLVPPLGYIRRRLAEGDVRRTTGSSATDHVPLAT